MTVEEVVVIPRRESRVMELASARGDPLGAKPEGAQRGNGVRERRSREGGG